MIEQAKVEEILKTFYERFMAVKISREVTKFKKGFNTDVIYLPTFIKLEVHSISRISYKDLSARLCCRLCITVKYTSEIKNTIKQLLKKGIKISFDRDDRVVWLQKKNKDVHIQNNLKQMKVYFTVNRFIITYLRIESLLFAPFQHIKCQLLMKVNQVKLEENGKKLEINFNILTHQAMPENILCSDDAEFGEFFVAHKYLRAKLLREDYHFKDESLVKKSLKYYQHDAKKREKKIKQTEDNQYEDFCCLLQEGEEDRFALKSESKPKPYSFALFTIQLYKKPLVAMLTIFLPISFLSCLNLAIFFQQGNLYLRIVNVGSLMVGFVALIPTIRRQMPENPSISLVELIVFSEAITTILALIQSLVVGYDQQYHLHWEDLDGFFLAALILTFVNFTGVIILWLLYLYSCFQYDHKPLIRTSEEENEEKYQNIQCQEDLQNYKSRKMMNIIKSYYLEMESQSRLCQRS